MNPCTNDIAVAMVALIVAATGLINVVVAYWQSKRLVQALSIKK